MTARFDARLMLSRHEGVHAIHNIEHHVEVARSTVEGEQTSRGYCVAHTIAKDDFADPFDRVVNSLVGPASDLHFFGQRWDYDTGDHCDAIKAARAIDENGYEDILRRAEKAAAAFVRDHEREIIAVGDRLYRKGELSGLAIRVLLNRIGELPEDVSQKEGTGVPRPKRKKKKDLQDHDQDQLDASDASQDNDEVEEPDVGEIEDIPQDTYTDLEHATQIQKKKKKKLGRAGRIGDAYYRTDGYISAGGLTVTSNWEPNEQALFERAVAFWSRGET
jgi:hypothetical protein